MELSVESAAAECPDRLAVISSAGSLSYRQLAARVAGAVSALARRGLGPGSLVAIRAANSPQTLIAILAFIESRMPFIPIHPRWTAREIAVIESDARPVFIFGDDDIGALLAESGDLRTAVAVAPADPLAILYTSGTTGTPKGAVLSRAAFLASARGSAHNLGWIEDDRWLLCLPICHVGGLSIVTRCLIARRTLVLLPRFDIAAVLAAIQQHRVTLLSVVPTMLRGLLDADEGQVLRSLRAVLCGGAATPFSVLERAVKAGVNVLTTYGLTEACSQVTVQDDAKVAAARPGSGRPLVGIQLSVRDLDGSELPAGTVGRIWIRGDSVMSGYLGQEPLAGRFFDTGDLGELDDAGVLRVHARRTDLIVSGGENVYPLEVEQALVAAPQVRAAIVFGVSDDRWGALVAAAIVVAPDFAGPPLELALSATLAPFKRPRLWAIVEAIPELPSGKVDRQRAVREFTPRLQKGWR